MLKRKQPNYATEALVKEICEDLVRAAIREQARDLEKHLKDIHDRLVVLEKTSLRP